MKIKEISKKLEEAVKRKEEIGGKILDQSGKADGFKRRRDEAKAEFESSLASGGDKAKAERLYKQAETDLFVEDSKLNGLYAEARSIDAEIEALERDLRGTRERVLTEEGERILREIRGLQQNLIGPLQRAHMISEAMKDNQGNRPVRFRIDPVRVRYLDPILIAQKAPLIPHATMTAVGGKDSPVMPVETLEPNPRVTEVTEWIPYQTAERLVRQGKAVVVEEREPRYDTKRVFDPLPEILADLEDLRLGRIVLRGASSAMREMASFIGPDLTTSAIGQTVPDKEKRSYIEEVEG
jgi:hypothetical protein